MDWSAFLGASVGAIVAIVALLGGLLGWDEISRRRQAAKTPQIPPGVFFKLKRQQ